MAQMFSTKKKFLDKFDKIKQAFSRILKHKKKTPKNVVVTIKPIDPSLRWINDR